MRRPHLPASIATRAGAAFSLLAARRWLGVGVALVVEVAALYSLGRLPSSDVVGIPGVLAAAIACTVAVVFGPLDGALVALAGAAAFGAAAGWDGGAVAALGVWPAIVAVVGQFARRVESRRAALDNLVAGQERERERVAVELHEQVAQSLAGALMALRAVGGAGDAADAAALAHARGLVQESIRELRVLAVDLRPQALDTYGVGPAVEALPRGVSERTGIPVAVEHDGLGRLPAELELALFRIVETALETAARDGTTRIAVRFRRGKSHVRLELDVAGPAGVRDAVLSVLRERVDLLGGRATEAAGAIRAEVPV